MTVSRAALDVLGWITGAAVGLLVNVAGVTAAENGWGFWVYWVLMVAATMAGAAAVLARPTRAFGLGLVLGGLAVFAGFLVTALVYVG